MSGPELGRCTGGTSVQRERKKEMKRGMGDANEMQRKQNRKYGEMG